MHESSRKSMLTIMQRAAPSGVMLPALQPAEVMLPGLLALEVRLDTL